MIPFLLSRLDNFSYSVVFSDLIFVLNLAMGYLYYFYPSFKKYMILDLFGNNPQELFFLYDFID